MRILTCVQLRLIKTHPHALVLLERGSYYEK